MGERTTGQHVLPRFLLRGFAAYTQKKQKYTYLFRSGISTGIPSNILKAAKRRLFYGEPDETGIEGALQEEENRYAPAVQRTLDAGAVAADDIDTLVRLIANLTIRTPHLRSGMSHAAGRTFALAQNLLSGESGVETLRKRVRGDAALLRGTIRKAIRSIPAFPREPLVHLLAERTAEQYVLEGLSNGTLLNTREVEASLAAFAQMADWESLAQEGHVRALKQSVAPQPKVDAYRRLSWAVVRMPEHSLVLGDFGPLGLASNTSEWRPLSVLGDKFELILLPLSHDTALIGYSQALPSLDWDELRRRTAALSSEFFVAAQDTERERELLPSIGTEKSLLTDAEFEELGKTLNAEPDEQPVPARGETLQITVELDGNPKRAEKAKEELGVLGKLIESAINDPGLSLPTKLRILVTDDLRRTVQSVARGYGYDDDVLVEGRPLTVLGKNLYANSATNFEGTVVVHHDLWDNDAPDMVLVRYQLAVSQVMRALIAVRRRAEGHQGASQPAATFQMELERLADETLAGHDAQRWAAAFITPFFTATDETGQPASPSDRLALAYLGSIRALLHRLGEIVRDRVQVYRETRSQLEEILPAAVPALNDLMQLLGLMVGMASDSFTARLPEVLADAPGFAEYLRDNWADLAKALREQERPEATATIVAVAQNILARMGLYVDDLDGGARDLIVGTPRLMRDS